MLRKQARLIARGVFINTKLFALELARALSWVVYLLLNIVQGIVKYRPPISWLRSISKRLTPNLPRKESFPRQTRFPSLP